MNKLQWWRFNWNKHGWYLVERQIRWLKNWILPNFVFKNEGGYVHRIRITSLTIDKNGLYVEYEGYGWGASELWEFNNTQ